MTPVKRGRGRPSNASKLAEQMRPSSVGLQINQRYDAAGGGRRLRGWNPPSAGPNTALLGLDKLRARARDSARNDWSGESSIQHWTTNLVGVGIQARENAKVPTSRKANRGELWARFCMGCDADNLLDFYGQQTLGVRSWLDAGEYFIRRRPRRSDSPLEVPLQIQLLESDYCPLFDADTFQFMPQGNRIRSGIELNSIGQRVAYWFFKSHPSDFGGVGYSFSPSADQLVRVSASDVSHVFEPKRIGQMRGVSHLAPVLARLRTIVNYDDAVLERQLLANLFVGFISRGLPDGSDPNVDPASGQTYQSGESGESFVALEPGALQELRPGEKIDFSNPPEAGTMYSEYMRTQNLGTAAGAGLPYELFSGDIANVSDRTLRIVINEFRRFCEQRQWQIVIPKHCQVVRNWFVDQAVLAGEIPFSFIDEAKAVTWVPHGWQYIHPVQDAQGKALEVKNGVRSRSSWITERGDDPEAVDNERKVDIDREKALGLPIGELEIGAGEPTQATTGGDSKPKPNN